MVETFDGNWVRIKDVMEKTKNKQMWNSELREVEFGIGSSRKEYAEWDYVVYSEFSR